MKTLKQIVTKLNLGALQPKPEAECKVVDSHEVQKTADANGNGDDVFNATNVKTVNRSSERHGHDKGEDEKAYKKVAESFAAFVAEKHLTPAELKKREEIAQAMERENPGMEKGKKMAIATAQAKKVAEDVDTSLLEFFLSLNEEEQQYFAGLVEEGNIDEFRNILSEEA